MTDETLAIAVNVARIIVGSPTAYSTTECALARAVIFLAERLEEEECVCPGCGSHEWSRVTIYHPETKKTEFTPRAMCGDCGCEYERPEFKKERGPTTL